MQVASVASVQGASVLGAPQGDVPETDNDIPCTILQCPDGHLLVIDEFGQCKCVKKQPPPHKCSKVPECSELQKFNYTICRCICLDGDSCTDAKILNLDTCLCECPAEADVCTEAQSLNSDTCECECKERESCGKLQKFNEDTCECECVKVIPAPIRSRSRSRSDSSRSGSDSGSNSGSSSDSGSKSGSSSDSGSRSGSKSGSKSGSSSDSGSKSGSSSSSSSSSGIIFADECPAGQVLNTRSCYCFYD